MRKRSILQPSFYLLLLLTSSFFNGVATPSQATPSGAFVTKAKPLETPGLYLVDFFVVQAYGDPSEGPVTHKTFPFRYRVYCPTQMVRNVTNGKWGEMVQASQERESGTGTMLLIVEQVCGKFLRR